MLAYLIPLILYLVVGALAIFGAWIGLLGVVIAFDGQGMQAWIGQIMTASVAFALAFAIHKLAQRFSRSSGR